MSETAASWSLLRGLRAAPPGRAASEGTRRAVFAAALEQAEQFLTAAASVDYATKPVQLFYALSQSTRAIAAARAGEPWEIRGHGAKVRERSAIPATAVEGDGNSRGALGVLARATESELWDGPVTLGELWASLPELPGEEVLVGGAVRALRLEFADADYAKLASRGVHSIRYRYGSAGAAQRSGLTWRVGITVENPPGDPEERRELIAAILAPYPTAQGWSIADGLIFSNIYENRRTPIFIEWVSQTEDGSRVLGAIDARTTRYGGHRYFRPGLGSSGAVPSSLVSWWGILLSLSSLARYQPVAWREALDIDRSPMAWALEKGLRTAETRIPELVLEALAAAGSDA